MTLTPCVSVTSSSTSTLKPRTIESIGSIWRFAFPAKISDLFMFPIDALTKFMLCCFSKVIIASKLPKESALMMIPFLLHFMFSVISSLNSFLTSSLFEYLMKGMPGRMFALSVI